MAYDETLAQRLRGLLPANAGFVEKKMFGGVGFMLHGNMCCGVINDSLIVRIPPETTAATLLEAHVKPFDMTGRAMKGWALVERDGITDDARLDQWVQRSIAFAATLPPK